MTTKRRVPAAKKATTAKRRTTTASKRPATATQRKRSTTRRTRTTRTTRRRTSTATTLGAGVGTVVVAFLVGAPWSVRIALLVVLLVAGVGYLIWSRRS